MLVPEERRERIRRFKSKRDAQNCLLGEVLVRSEIVRLTGADSRQLVIKSGKHGKPYLPEHPDMQFNISHSGYYIAMSIDDEPVGIDIECIREKTDIAKIARRFFAPAEIEYIMTESVNEQRRRFFEVWTKKESKIKREGGGLSIPLTSFCVLDDNRSSRTCRNNFNMQEKTYFHKIIENDEAICHVCSAKKEPPHIRTIGVEKLEV